MVRQVVYYRVVAISSTGMPENLNLSDMIFQTTYKKMATNIIYLGREIIGTIETIGYKVRANY